MKLATVVVGDPKAHFSIDTAARCKGGRYSFPWIAPLTLDPYLIMLSVKQRGIKYHFYSFWYDSTRAVYIYIYIYIYIYMFSNQY